VPDGLAVRCQLAQLPELTADLAVNPQIGL
jgi:hypothetical protein